MNQKGHLKISMNKNVNRGMKGWMIKRWMKGWMNEWMAGSKVRDNLHKAVSLISSKRELKKG